MKTPVKYQPITSVDGALAALEPPAAVCAKMAAIPPELMTREVIAKAVKADGTAIQYIPPALLTEDVIIAAMQEEGDALAFVPFELRTRAVCLKAVKRRGDALQHVPHGLRDEQMVMTACKYASYALKWVNDRDLFFRVAKALGIPIIL